MHQASHHDQAAGMPTRSKWVLAGFIAIALFFLLTEHRAPLFGALPYLLLLGCPLMHLFHEHGHYGHRMAGRDARPDQPGVVAPTARENNDA